MSVKRHASGAFKMVFAYSGINELTTDARAVELLAPFMLPPTGVSRRLKLLAPKEAKKGRGCS